MLVDIDSGRAIDLVPYRAQFDHLKSRLSSEEFEAILERINELIDESGPEIATSAWLPRSDWSGTALEPIFSKAAQGDADRSAMFFGQIVWYALMRRPERWASPKYELDIKQIRSRTYVRLPN